MSSKKKTNKQETVDECKLFNNYHITVIQKHEVEMNKLDEFLLLVDNLWFTGNRPSTFQNGLAFNS